MNRQEIEQKLIEIRPILEGIIYKFFSKQLSQYEDLYQEAMLSAIKALNKFDDTKEASLKTYLQIVVRNDLIIFSKKNCNFYQHEYCVDDDFLKCHYEEEEDHTQLDREIVYNKIKDSLSKQEKQVLDLLLQGYQFKEIDAILGISNIQRAVVCNNIKRKINNLLD